MKYKLEIGIAGLWLLSMFFLFFFRSELASINQAVYEFLLSLNKAGLVGVFFITFLSNFIVFVQIPYYLIVIEFVTLSQDLYYLMLLALLIGLGTTLGEIVKYITIKKVIRIIPKIHKSKLVVILENYIREHKRLVPLFIFVYAFTPLPDDMMILPLSLTRYGIRKIFLPILAGKILLSFIIVFGFETFRRVLLRDVALIDISAAIMITFIILLLYSGIQINATRKDNR